MFKKARTAFISLFSHRRSLYLAAVAIVLVVHQPIALAATYFYSDQSILFYDKDAGGVCSPASSGPIGTLPSDAAISGAISGADKYKSLYQKVGTAKNVPWQMLAAIHYREIGYGTTNPSNGEGLFGFHDLALSGVKFPPGPVTTAELERQLGLLADLLIAKADATPIADLKPKSLSADNSDARLVKDTFFSYNGRAPQYAKQATGFGFSATTDPFEGSPYVLNLLDAKHTPKTNPTGWGGFISDGTFGYYPQYNSSQVGAFVLYAALGGASVALGGSCNNVSVSGNQIVDVARAELAKNIKEIPLRCDAGNTSAPGSCGPEIDKYTDSHLEYWCADFVSWVYKTAGVPFTGGASGGWRLASTSAVQQLLAKQGTYFSAKDTTKKPAPGDAIFFGSSVDNLVHIGIVDTVSGDNVTTIEGNTSTDATNNGNGVGSHTYNYRTSNWVVGFGRY